MGRLSMVMIAVGVSMVAVIALALLLPDMGERILHVLMPHASIAVMTLALALALPFWAEGLAALLQGAWRRWKGRPLFKAGSLSLWLQKRGGAVSAFYVFCALALLGVLAALRAAQL